MRTLTITLEYDQTRPDLLKEELQRLADLIVLQVEEGNDWGDNWSMEMLAQ
jgi:hypothetical protein